MLKQEIVYTIRECKELLRHGALDQAGVAHAAQKLQALEDALTGEMPEPAVTEPEEPEAEHAPRRRGRGAAKAEEEEPEDGRTD